MPSEENVKKYALLGDEPVLEAEREDALEFGPTAEVLAGAALYTPNPITIGVFGAWGSGKTSLMRLMMDIVKEKGKGDDDDLDHLSVPVWFNAWQYEREEHLIIPLISTIAREITKKEKEWERISLDDTLSDAAKKGWKALKEGSTKVHAALRSVLYGISMKGKLGVPGTENAVEISASMKDMIERYEALTQDTLMARSLYFDAFDRLRELAQDMEIKKPKIVVFIDDLDRCFPEQAVRLLESIKLVLHQQGFAFVLGIFPQIIEEFIRNKYAKEYHFAASAATDPELQKRMNVYLNYFGDYLGKIVQVKAPIPKREPKEMAAYIEGLIEKSGAFSGDDIENAIPLIAEAGGRNPREIVRLLNRVLVRSRIEKELQPIALLLDIAMEDESYDDFRAALDISIILDDGSGEQKAPMTIGEIIAERLKDYSGDFGGLMTELRNAKEKAKRKPELETAIKTLEKRQFLCNLLKAKDGLQWLTEKAVREKLREPEESSAAERKEKSELKKAARKDMEDPIRELELNMVAIPKGEFNMGSKEHDSEQPVHLVKLEGFRIGAMPVTQAQFEAVMGENPSEFKNPDNPVECVTWEDATAFCRKLSERTKRDYKLPTEAQWEYACRSGSAGKYCFGDDASQLGEYAWFDGNSDNTTHPVGQKKPNNWGMYDIHGNVWEWCLDRWHENYKGAPNDGSAWEEGDSQYRVLRGGNWDYVPGLCRSAIRCLASPGTRISSIGFRVLAASAAGK